MVKIEMWADVVCPWCGIANERMNRALAEFGEDDVEFVHHSYRLSPDLPEDHGFDLVESMTERGGMSPADASAMFARVEGIAHADGIANYHVGDGRTGNTMRIHELLAFATARGVQRAAWDAAFTAHFGKRRDLWDLDALADFADSLGLNGDEARHAIESGHYAQQVRDEQAEAQALGAQGVPFIVVDRRFAVSGAQSVETLVGVLERARAAAGENEPEAVDA